MMASGAHICVGPSVVMEAQQFRHCSHGTVWNKGQQTSLCFKKVVRLHCCPPEQLSPHATVCQKVSSSCFSFFNPSYPLLNKSHIHSSPIIHFKQSFVNASSLVAFSNQNSIPACCFNRMSMDHFRINCGAAICQVYVATNRI